VTLAGPAHERRGAGDAGPLGGRDGPTASWANERRKAELGPRKKTGHGKNGGGGAVALCANSADARGGGSKRMAFEPEKGRRVFPISNFFLFCFPKPISNLS